MTTALVIVLVVGMALAIAVVVTILKLVWHATGNLLDWLIYTFGNEDAAREVKKRWETDDDKKPR